jgi:diaminohydroxyphosphoribosylaminopyrimidine deaminase/5-amino-6-(5-phosphoribosylamino)uracil reductase
MDGKITDNHGKSKWITGNAARRVVHQLRRKVDAVMVGSGTVKADNPSLLPAGTRRDRPCRVLVDSAGSISPRARVFTDGRQSLTIVATTGRCPARRRRQYEKTGATVWKLPATKTGLVPLKHLLRRLGREGVLHVLCEGGGELAASLLRSGLVDEMLLFVAPIVIGGRTSGAAVSGEGWRLAKCPRFRFVDTRQVGDDLFLKAKPVFRAARKA